MAIQIPDAGTGNGATGDNEFVLWTKVINNFSDQTNAASRLVGNSNGQIPLWETVKSLAGTEGGNSLHGVYTAVSNRNVAEVGAGERILYGAYNTGLPSISFGNVQMVTGERLAADATIIQRVYNPAGEGLYRVGKAGDAASFSAWKPFSAHTQNYTSTSAAGANVVVDATGRLMRSTSSERYKDIIAPLELDDTRYADAMALKPIVYRSLSVADNPLHHYYSFSAEELGAHDKAFTLWRYEGTYTDKDGTEKEVTSENPIAEGININALLAMSHAIAIKQDKLIKSLEARIDVLEAK